MSNSTSLRAARIAALLHGTSLEVRPSARCGGEEGLFSTEAVEEGMVLLTDCALCWLPVEEGAPQSLVADASRSNCEQCGAFIGSPAAILQKLAGDADADADADVVGAGVKRRTIDVLTTVICRQCHKTFFLRL